MRHWSASLAYCLREKLFFFLFQADLFSFFCPSCAGAVVYQISSQICTYSESGNTAFDVAVLLFCFNIRFLVPLSFCSPLSLFFSLLDITPRHFFFHHFLAVQVAGCLSTDVRIFVSLPMNTSLREWTSVKIVPRLAPPGLFMFRLYLIFFRGEKWWVTFELCFLLLHSIGWTPLGKLALLSRFEQLYYAWSVLFSVATFWSSCFHCCLIPLSVM